jgi:hypothetical protein
LPLQAQALEVLTADARRMMFPDSGSWFRAHAEVTDDYLREGRFPVADPRRRERRAEPDHPGQRRQAGRGLPADLFGQYDLATRMDRINAEAFKLRHGRRPPRMETKNVYINEARGVRKETQRMPVLVPVSIKNVYLDDADADSMHSAQVLGEADDRRGLDVLRQPGDRRRRGSTDPDDEDGGWMPQNLRGLEPTTTATCAPRDGGRHRRAAQDHPQHGPAGPSSRSRSAAGKGGKVSRAVVRCRFRKYPFSSYLLFPYHYESATDAYPTSPLMKGRTVQIMAVQALNRALDAAALKNSPPVGYDKTDQTFAPPAARRFIRMRSGHRPIRPRSRRIPSSAAIPATMAAALTLAMNMYAELTGVCPAGSARRPRAHDGLCQGCRDQRGAVRTVDYVRQVGQGAYTRWLDMAYAWAATPSGARAFRSSSTPMAVSSRSPRTSCPKTPSSNGSAPVARPRKRRRTSTARSTRPCARAAGPTSTPSSTRPRRRRPKHCRQPQGQLQLENLTGGGPPPPHDARTERTSFRDPATSRLSRTSSTR